MWVSVLPWPPNPITGVGTTSSNIPRSFLYTTFSRLVYLVETLTPCYDLRFRVVSGNCCSTSLIF